MSRKNSVLLLCLLMFILIPNFSLAEPINVSNGFVTIPTGGGIVFPGGSILSDPAGITGPMGPMGPEGPSSSGAITANAVIKVCTGSTTCSCDSGKVIKALLAVTCPPNHFLERSALIDASATGWTAGCNYIKKTFIDLNDWYGNPAEPLPERLVLQTIDVYGSNPDNIVIACTTP
jgi:hypothetical protein